MSDKKVAFIINGGFGKNIQATAVVKAYYEKYPESTIYVLSSYPEAFVNLPFIKKFFPNQPLPYLYDELKEFELIDVEPYRDLEYSKGRTHIVDAWCKMINVDAPIDKRGLIELDIHEMNDAIATLARLNLPKERPLIAFQFQGGTSYYNAQDAQDMSRVKHYRDLSVQDAQKIVNGLTELGYIVLQISLPTEPQLDKCIHLETNKVTDPRKVFALLSNCAGLVTIDSFAQHAWAALGKSKAVVLWGGTNPTNLGYSSNTNLTSSRGKECKTLHCNRPDTFRFDVVGNGKVWTCKHKGKCMQFDAKEVIEALKANVPIQQAPQMQMGQPPQPPIPTPAQ